MLQLTHVFVDYFVILVFQVIPLNTFIVNSLPISSTGCFAVASQGGTLTLAVTFSWHLLWFEYLVGPTLSAFHCYSLSLSLPPLLSLSVFVSPAHTLLISLAKNAFPVKCKKEMMWCSPALTCNQSLPPSSSYFCYFTARHTAPSQHSPLPSFPHRLPMPFQQFLAALFNLSNTLPLLLPLSVSLVAAMSTKTGLLSQANSVKYLSNVKVHPVWVCACVCVGGGVGFSVLTSHSLHSTLIRCISVTAISAILPFVVCLFAVYPA